MKSDATTWIPGCDEHHDARASDHWHTRECPTNHRDRDQRRKERQDRTDVGQSLLERVCVRDSQCNDTLQHDRTGRHLAFGDPEPRWQVAVRDITRSGRRVAGGPRTRFGDARTRSADLTKSIETRFEGHVSRDGLAASQVRLHDPARHLGGYLTIPDVVGLHDNGASVVTSTETAGPSCMDRAVETFFGKRSPQGERDIIRATLRAGVAVAHEDEPMRARKIPSSHTIMIYYYHQECYLVSEELPDGRPPDPSLPPLTLCARHGSPRSAPGCVGIACSCSRAASLWRRWQRRPTSCPGFCHLLRRRVECADSPSGLPG